MDLDSSRRTRDNIVSCRFTPAITDLILNENRKCYYNELEQTITLLHNEWSKEIGPSRQNTTHHPLIVSNPIDKIGSEFMRRNMRWEAPSMPTATFDPRFLSEQETPLVIWKTWFLDQDWIKKFQQVVSSGSKTRWKYGKSEWTKRKSSRRKIWLHAWTQDEDRQSLAGDGTFWKSRSVGKATSWQ